MLNIRRVDRVEPRSLPALRALLQDSVHGGASVGFLAPLSAASADRYWQQVSAALAGNLRLWTAEIDGEVVGTVQLDLCGKQNGRHRAELQKLLVHSAQRGKGIASLLLRAAEEYAAQDGRTLLVLDTLTGSFAENVYRHHGWQFVGCIPDYAGAPDGVLYPTAVYYKRIAPR